MYWRDFYENKIENLRQEMDKQQTLLNKWRDKSRWTDDPRKEGEAEQEIEKINQKIDNLETEIRNYLQIKKEWESTETEINQLIEDEKYREYYPLLEYLQQQFKAPYPPPEQLTLLRELINRIKQIQGNSLNHDFTKPFELPDIESSPPHCPVIFLLDTAESVSKEYFEQLYQGLNTFEKQISNDTSIRFFDITIITIGGSARVLKSSDRNQKFMVPNLTLHGPSVMGQGIEKALKILESKNIDYYQKNIQYLTPWIFLIHASIPQDNWQEPVTKIKHKIFQKQINFVSIGIRGENYDILSQIMPNHYLLEDLKFKPLFYWIANTVKGMPKNYFLTRLAETVAILEWYLLPQHSKRIEEHLDKLITEVSKCRPEQNKYKNIVAEFSRDVVAMKIGDLGKPIIDLIKLIDHTLELS